MKTIILGGGIAGLSLAHFLKTNSVILEKEDLIGGLCRSYDLNGIMHDVGPHILFSKNKEVLSILTSLTETNTLRRSNKILYKGRQIKYPFENELSALKDDERDYCLQEFLNNPYEDYNAENMLQFFLKIFGEGITRTYLQPYNEKIWKFDPSCMDMQMVERIPKPPKEDIIKSAQGVPTEGYKHQLNFYYPKKGGVQSLVNSFADLIAKKASIVTSVNIKKMQRVSSIWHVETDQGSFSSETLVNCMPLHQLFRYIDVPDQVREKLGKLKYTSINIVNVQAKKDNMADNLAFYVPDKDVIFHRITKLNFFGDSYCLPDGGSTMMIEITFRPNSFLSKIPQDVIKQKVIDGLEKLNLVKQSDITAIDIKRFEYAYVIYDLDHRKNVDFILNYLAGVGIFCCGRFAEFEYLNTDGVLERSIKLADRLNKKNISIDHR